MSHELEGQVQAVPYQRARNSGLRYLLLATPCGKKQPFTSWTMCSSTVKVTPERSHRTYQPPIAIISRGW